MVFSDARASEGSRDAQGRPICERRERNRSAVCAAEEFVGPIERGMDMHRRDEARSERRTEEAAAPLLRALMSLAGRLLCA